jgi:hypothetical protein
MTTKKEIEQWQEDIMNGIPISPERQAKYEALKNKLQQQKNVVKEDIEDEDIDTDDDDSLMLEDPDSNFDPSGLDTVYQSFGGAMGFFNHVMSNHENRQDGDLATREQLKTQQDSRYYKSERMIEEIVAHGYKRLIGSIHVTHLPASTFNRNTVLRREYEPTELSNYLSFTCYCIVPKDKRKLHFQVRVNDLPYFEVIYEYRYVYNYFNFFEGNYNRLCEHLIMKLFQLKEHTVKQSKIKYVKIQNCYTKFFNIKKEQRL